MASDRGCSLLSVDGQRHRARKRDISNDRSPLFWATAAYLLTTLFLGGAGQHYPLVTALIQLLGICVLALAVTFGGIGRLASPSRFANLLVVAAIALPLLQLVPLPYTAWVNLPGHDVAAAIFDVSGVTAAAQPLSLNRWATLGSALSLIPPVAMYLVASRFGVPEQVTLLKLCVGVAVASAVLGALQAATGGALSVWPSAHRLNSPGLFINRNHQAVFLLLSMPLTAAIANLQGLRGSNQQLALVGGVILVLVAGVIATTSRMGFVLLPIALLTAVALSLPKILSVRRLLIALGMIVLLAVSLSTSDAVGVVLRRFADRDVRFDYWSDSWLGALQFWPWGSGLGTFADVFPSVENLNVIGPARVPHAHNDYVQLLLEGGLPAAVLLLAFVAFLFFAAVQAAREKRDVARLKFASISSVLIVLLHSVVDYPARMFSVSVSCALLLAVLVGRAQDDSQPT